MTVKIGTEGAQFPEKEYKYRIFLAVHEQITHLFLYMYCTEQNERFVTAVYILKGLVALQIYSVARFRD
jgi:hypothetical protein